MLIKDDQSTEITKSFSKKSITISSQLEGPTQKNKFGYKFSQMAAVAKDSSKDFLRILSLEVHGTKHFECLFFTQ